MEAGRYRVVVECDVTNVAGDTVFHFDNGRKLYVWAPEQLFHFERVIPEPPEDAVVVDEDGDAWQRGGDDPGDEDLWFMAGALPTSDYFGVPWDEVVQYGPKVVYTPA